MNIYYPIIKWSLTLIFLCYLTGSASGVQQGEFRFNRNKGSVIIPIQVRNNLAVVPLFINDHGPFHFILDTGVNTTILTEPRIAHMTALNIEDEILIYGLGGEGIVEAALASNVKINMRGITGTDLNMVVIPEDILSFSESFGFPVYGIIGYDFLQHFPVEISYASETMRVYNNRDYRIYRRSRVLPFKLVHGKPYIESTIIGEHGDTLTTNLLLDLGASHPVYLNNDYINMSDHTIESFLGKGIGGNLMGRMGFVQKLKLGDLIIDRPIVSYPDREFLEFYGTEIEWEGIIGGGIIHRFNVILDYPSEKVIFRPASKYNDPFHTNLSGLEVVARGLRMRKFVIHYVRPGSIAYESGIRAGDQIITLNNKTHVQFTMEDVMSTLSEREGRRISMSLLRGDELIRVNFRLREDLY